MCACGAPPAEHGPYTNPPLVWRDAGYVGALVTLHYSGVCPGKETHLRRGTFRETAPTVTVDWFGLRVPPRESDLSAEPDRVPRRPAECMDEIAPASLKLGKAAVARGCGVEPYYRVTDTGARRCILRIEHGPAGFRAVAVWAASEHGKWAANSAAVVGRGPVGMKALGQLISAIEQ